MVGNVTIFLKVIMELLYYSLCSILLNEGKTSRLAFPLIKKNTGLCQWAGAARKKVMKSIWQELQGKNSQIKRKNELLILVAKLMDGPSNLFSFVCITDHNS